MHVVYCTWMDRRWFEMSFVWLYSMKLQPCSQNIRTMFFMKELQKQLPALFLNRLLSEWLWVLGLIVHLWPVGTLTEPADSFDCLLSNRACVLWLSSAIYNSVLCWAQSTMCQIMGFWHLHFDFTLLATRAGINRLNLSDIGRGEWNLMRASVVCVLMFRMKNVLPNEKIWCWVWVPIISHYGTFIMLKWDLILQ